MYRQTKKETPETLEKIAIKEYLDVIGAFHYPNTAGIGTFDGVPDRTCIYKGHVYQIEVKARNKKDGKMSKQRPEQANFQYGWEKNGGVYILGGIDEVMKIIKP